MGAGLPLALGVIGASAVMCLRVLIATAVLNARVSFALLPYLVAPSLAAAFISWWGIRKNQECGTIGTPPSNPLQFGSALQMAILFQTVLFAMSWVQPTLGQTGVFVSAGVLGITDVDALVVSVAKGATAQLAVADAARAIAIGVLTNTLLKLSIATIMGVKTFRRLAALGLFTVALASSISLVWIR